jgi:hypothetical protein
MEFILVCVRGSSKHLSKAKTVLTPAGKAFLTTITKVQPLTWVNQFEAFAINGISGLPSLYLWYKEGWHQIFYSTGVLHNHELRKDEMKGHIREALRAQIGK